jgi:DNA-binding GntR family transcriptional regulator
MATSRIRPIEDSKKTIAAIVEERIQQAILEGILPPGARIDQNKLAADLNVSIVPVREALKKLEAEGFVRINPRRGAFVTETSVENMEDLYFARSLMEGEAAFYAAPRLTEADLKSLDRLNDEMNRTLEAHDYEGFSAVNHKFHFAIYSAAGSAYLCNAIATLWDLAVRYRFRYLMLKDQAEIIRQEHLEILNACRAHDGDRLRKAIVAHMYRTMQGIKEHLLAAHHEQPDH